MGPKPKKIKVEESSPSAPFTMAGVYDDEIILEFTKEKLYVSKNFLCISSPVFEAMFKNECEEKKEKHVQMTGKSYADFLEFLLCMHPRIQKDINEKNVLRIVPLAHEYLVTAIVEKCKTAMKSILLKAQRIAIKCSTKGKHLQPLRECFKVLKSAISLSFNDISDLSVDAIARFGYCFYNDKPYNENEFGYDASSKIFVNLILSEETYGGVRNDCISLFKSLEAEWRNTILSRRLEKINDNSLK